MKDRVTNRSRNTEAYYWQQQRRDKGKQSSELSSSKKHKSRTTSRATQRKVEHLNKTSPASSTSNNISYAGLAMLVLVVSSSVNDTYTYTINRPLHDRQIDSTNPASNNKPQADVPNSVNNTELQANVTNSTSEVIIQTSDAPSINQRFNDFISRANDTINTLNNSTYNKTDVQLVKEIGQESIQFFKMAKEQFDMILTQSDILYNKHKDTTLQDTCYGAKSGAKSDLESPEFRGLLTRSMLSAGLSIGLAMAGSTGNCVFDYAISKIKKQMNRCAATAAGAGLFNIMINEVIERVANLGIDSVKKLMETCKEFRDKNIKFLDILADDFTNKTNDFMDLMVSLMTKTDDFSGNIEQKLKFFEEQIDLLSKLFDTGIKKYYDALYYARDAVKEHIEEIKNFSTETYSKSLGYFEENYNNLLNNSSQTQIDIKKEIEQQAKKYLDTLDPALEVLSDNLNVINNTATKTEEYVEQAKVENFYDIANDGINEGFSFLDLVSDTFNSVTSYIEIYMQARSYSMFIPTAISLLLLLKQLYGNKKQKKLIVENRKLLTVNIGKIRKINDTLANTEEQTEQKEPKLTVDPNNTARFRELFSSHDNAGLKNKLDKINEQIVENIEEIHENIG